YAPEAAINRNRVRRNSNGSLSSLTTYCCVRHHTWFGPPEGRHHSCRASRGRCAVRHRCRKLDRKSRHADACTPRTTDRCSCLQRIGHNPPHFCRGNSTDDRCPALARGRASRGACDLVFELSALRHHCQGIPVLAVNIHSERIAPAWPTFDSRPNV